MHWNHRVFVKKIPDGEGGQMDWFTIREAYYNDKNEVDGWTADPLEVSGENILEMRQTLEWMLKALDNPVVEENENGISLERKPAPSK